MLATLETIAYVKGKYAAQRKKEINYGTIRNPGV
jgi:hypothetical protein